MASALYPAGRPATAAEVLDAGFRIFRSTLLPTLPYALLAMLAGKLPRLEALLRPAPAGSSAITDPWWWLLDLAAALLVVCLVAAILERQQSYLAGMPADFRHDLRSALRRTGPATLVLVGFLLALAACFAPLRLVPATHLTTVGVILALPAVYLGVVCPNACLAAALSARNAWAAVVYGWQLVRGQFWRTLLMYVIGVAVLAVFVALAGVLAGLILALAGNANLALMTAVSAQVAAAMASIALPFYAALALAVYRELEARHAARGAQDDSAARLSVPT